MMTDRYTDELFEHENSIVFSVSRLVCDVERFRNESDEETCENIMISSNPTKRNLKMIENILNCVILSMR